MKIIESERARTVSFSKRKKTLLEDAKKFATQTGADVGVMLFSPGGKPCSYGSTSIEEIIENFLKVKLEDRQRDYVEGKSNEIPRDKHMEDQKLAMKLRVEKIKKETQNSILVEHLKFDLNVAPEPEDEQES
ncbi:agamous-like MADS-box protein AGL29 [Solanum stenotomum]|uniref:agamous-like MADS-box protein AGL29 n=1 Tax=Solanum stenotomum TaxID=172797 RepID=UPI0020D102A5|nr:agamous-like MADS-box protein AGL29 [Solanum stenotomum]